MRTPFASPQTTRPFFSFISSKTHRMLRIVLCLTICLAALSCQSQAPTGTAPKKAGTEDLAQSAVEKKYGHLSKAYFAGGCFWCTEAVFEPVRGVEAVYSGYTGGSLPNATYEEVGRGGTGHAEAIVVYFDSAQVSYRQLLVFFFASHDPTTPNRQGPDVGPEYRSAVFYLNDAQRQTAQQYIAELNAAGKFLAPIVTEVTPAGPFYLAEEYHQNYYERHPENPYVQRITRPKVEKFVREFAEWLK